MFLVSMSTVEYRFVIRVLTLRCKGLFIKEFEYMYKYILKAVKVMCTSFLQARICIQLNRAVNHTSVLTYNVHTINKLQK